VTPSPAAVHDPEAGGPARWVHEVPTHLDVQDRALLGLTVRQVLCLASAAACSYGLWSRWPALPVGLRLGLAALCVGLGLVLALVRPGGRGLGEWALAALRYAGAPRRCVWRPVPAAVWGVPPAGAGPSPWEEAAAGAGPWGRPAAWTELTLRPAWAPAAAVGGGRGPASWPPATIGPVAVVAAGEAGGWSR
jgi:hypothetical protein